MFDDEVEEERKWKGVQPDYDMLVLSMKVTNSNYGIEHNAYEGMREKREV